jgi:integrase
MSSAILQSGTEIASDLRNYSHPGTITDVPLNTIGDLLAILEQRPPRSLAMLKTTCGLLGVYLNQPCDQILLDTVEAKRGEFRQFLATRKYAENSIRAYVFQTRFLMNTAHRLGWRPTFAASEEWNSLLALAPERQVLGIVENFARITRTPAEVTIEHMERWVEFRFGQGISIGSVVRAKNRFWRLLKDTGWLRVNPSGLGKGIYGIPLNQLPEPLGNEIQKLLKWKQAEFAPSRPRRGKVRAISAGSLKQSFCQLAGYAISICGLQPLSVTELLQKDLVEAFVEWAINERGIKGWSIKFKLVTIVAVVNHHPSFRSQDFSWLKILVDSIPLEDESERKQRKARKYVEYDVLETIPSKIRAAMEDYERARNKKPKRLSRLAMEQLMIQWLLVLPWRQRNVRECRISGSSPNLFKSKILAFSELDKPAWVVEEEQSNPNAEFWQVKFSPNETKTGIAIHILLPRQLITRLEEYLTKYRPQLLGGRNTDTLFVNEDGMQLCPKAVGNAIGDWTLRVAGIRSTPHLFRDAVAFKWLKVHPKDFLTLSKMLWHKNVQTTIQIYGARFNESSGVCAMEAWLDEREVTAK